METGCLLNFIGGEESSASNDYVMLIEHTDFASLQFDPGGYLSGGFIFDPGDSYLFTWINAFYHCIVIRRDHWTSTSIVSP